MLHGLSQDEDDPLDNLDVTQLDITSQEDYILDEAAGNNVWSYVLYLLMAGAYKAVITVVPITGLVIGLLLLALTM